jgi:hypothetical protein
VLLAINEILGNLLLEIIQYQWVIETKIQGVLRTLRRTIYPEMLDSKGF